MSEKKENKEIKEQELDKVSGGVVQPVVQPVVEDVDNRPDSFKKNNNN